MKKLILITLLLNLYAIINAQNCSSLYIDYSVSNFDDAAYVFPVNANATSINTSIVKEAAVVFNANPIAGYTDPNDAINTLETYYLHSFSLDSVFLYCTHENNSGQYNKIIVYVCGVDNNGKPDLNNIIWSHTDSTNVSLSPGGNYIGQGAGFLIALELPSISVQAGNSVAIGVKYLGSITDTFALMGSYVDNGLGGADIPSQYQNSFLKMEPNYPNWTKNSTIGYGNPTGSAGWYEAQNWGIWAFACVDDNADSSLITQVCKVTADTTGQHWTVIWEKGYSPFIDSYGIQGAYTNGTTVEYTQSASTFSSFTDTLPIADTHYFMVLAKNTNNVQLYGSPAHRPIFLSISNSASNALITYNQYYGLAYNYNRIYRGTTPNNMALYDSIPFDPINNPSYTYLDPEPNSYGNYYYQMEATFNTSCQPSMPTDNINNGYEKISSKSFSRSNIVYLSTVGLTEQQVLLNNISLYPNPTQNVLNINLGKADNNNVLVQLFNTLGQVVCTYMFTKNDGQKLTIDVATLPNGVYYAQVQAFGGIKTLRLVKN